MDLLNELFDVLAHRVGAFILRTVTGGRVTARSGYAYGFAVVSGTIVLLAPFVGLLIWKLSST